MGVFGIKTVSPVLLPVNMDDKVSGGTTWNQVTKQETVIEREKKRRSWQSLRSPSLQQ